MVGETLTTDDGAWWGYPGPIVSRAWQRCDAAGACTSVPYGNDRTYRVRHTDVGWRLRVAVTVASILGSSSAASVQTGVVAPAAPVTTATPTVTDAPLVGTPISATPATWEGADTIRRAWDRAATTPARARRSPAPAGSSTGSRWRTSGHAATEQERLATNTIGTSRIASLRTVAVVAPEARSLALLLRTLVPIPGGRTAIRVRCALDRPGIRTCEAVIRHGRTVLTRAAASSTSHTAASVIVRLPVTAALRRVAARPPGSAVTLTASATQDAHGGTWSKTRTLLAAPSTALTVPSRSIFGRTRAHFRPPPPCGACGRQWPMPAA